MNYTMNKIPKRFGAVPPLFVRVMLPEILLKIYLCRAKLALAA